MIGVLVAWHPTTVLHGNGNGNGNGSGHSFHKVDAGCERGYEALFGRGPRKKLFETLKKKQKTARYRSAPAFLGISVTQLLEYCEGLGEGMRLSLIEDHARFFFGHFLQESVFKNRTSVKHPL